MLTTNRLHPYASPWRLFNQLHADINRELSDWFATAPNQRSSSVGVWTRPDAAIVATELPGFELKDINVSVHRDVLTIEAGNATEDIPEGANVLRRERSRQAVNRQLQLPFELDPQSVEATYERGMLVVRLAAHESAQPAHIEVKAG